MISRDKNAITPGTAAFARMEKYRALVDNLDIFVPGHSWRLPRRRYDLVTSQDPFETGVVAWIAARLVSAKLELQIHTDFLSPAYARESLKNKIRVRIARFLVPKADCVRVVSPRIAVQLRANGYKLKAEPVVLPIFVQVQSLASNPRLLKEKYPQFETIFLMASRLTREKNIGMAIEAMAEVVKTHPKTGLVIVGAGPQREELELQVARYKLQASVVFEPWNKSLADYYASADAFVLTSNYEGYGLTLVEAAAAGCPIITTDVGTVGDLITDDCAIVVPVGDRARLVSALRFCIEDRDWQTNARARLAGFREKIASEDEYLARLKAAWVTCGAVR